ncbi:MAG TPA: Smr/MutS family protein [Stellaceae bacterium]|nr:Smr/MutS family protein [Stellaceae bacterium]
MARRDEAAATEPAAQPPPASPISPRQTAPRAVPPAPGTGIDRRSAQRLRRGDRPIEARLDLHGMTQEEAHRALAGFVARAWSGERRTLLVITGKGGARGGVLRAAVPRWLGEAPNAGRVLAIAPAQPKDGGAGAFYVLLRRRR